MGTGLALGLLQNFARGSVCLGDLLSASTVVGHRHFPGSLHPKDRASGLTLYVHYDFLFWVMRYGTVAGLQLTEQNANPLHSALFDGRESQGRVKLPESLTGHFRDGLLSNFSPRFDNEEGI